MVSRRRPSRNSRPFTNEAGHLIVQRADNLWKPFDPRSRPLALRQKHFHGILMAEQALGKRAVETSDNGLVSVNLGAAAADVSLVAFHFLRHSPPELAARVNLQHLRLSQRTVPVNRLEGLCNLGRVFRGEWLRLFVTAGNVDNSERILVNLSSTRQLVMGQKKKVCLMDRVGRRHVEFRARNVSRGGKINLPDSLLDEPFLAASANFLIGEMPFQ